MESKERISIATLRWALACIWTELEKDEPNVYGCQDIANQALELSKEYAKPKDLTNDLNGVEAWIDRYPMT